MQPVLATAAAAPAKAQPAGTAAAPTPRELRAPITGACTAEATASGVVWGAASLPTTAASAARHTGRRHSAAVIPPQGGEARVLLPPSARPPRRQPPGARRMCSVAAPCVRSASTA
jgi:hypothetical protein